jgi:hypothetical protein
MIENSYNNQIQYSFVRYPVSFDYSCQTNDYQIQFIIRNVGAKSVQGLEFSITNPLCVGALPFIPNQLNSSSALNFFVQTTAPNGTMTLSGNNTYVQIKF